MIWPARSGATIKTNTYRNNVLIHFKLRYDLSNIVKQCRHKHTAPIIIINTIEARASTAACILEEASWWKKKPYRCLNVRRMSIQNMLTTSNAVKWNVHWRAAAAWPPFAFCITRPNTAIILNGFAQYELWKKEISFGCANGKYFTIACVAPDEDIADLKHVVFIVIASWVNAWAWCPSLPPTSP